LPIILGKKGILHPNRFKRKNFYLNFKNNILIFFCSIFWVVNANPNLAPMVFGDAFIEEEIKIRLESMSCLVKPIIDVDVLDQVKRFVFVDKASSRKILSRRELYFPLIDKLLLENNLPTELKFLTAIESAINPGVKSYAGAAGLWQFMPSTAKLRGLRVDDKVDERLDPVKSTLAAIDYLKSLYGLFGDWALVFAAYNCGENKILDLIEKNGTRDFWTLRKDLPRQTQLFVPAFIGVSYLMHFYGEHELIPSLEDINIEPLTYARIFKEIDFKKMYKSTGLDKEIFETYNPAFKKNSIPARENGLYVNLPDSLMVLFVDYYLNELDEKKSNISTDSTMIDEEVRIDIITFNRPYQFLPEDIEEFKAQELDHVFLQDASINKVPQSISEKVKDYVYHIVSTRETLSNIVDQYNGLTKANLMDWNGLGENKILRPGTVLIIKK